MNRPVKIIQRNVNRGIEKRLVDAGYHPLVARIVAGRPLVNERDPEEFIRASLQSLDSPDSLSDIGKASRRIADAIVNEEVIGQLADYDADGNGVMSVSLTALTAYFAVPRGKIKPFIGDRLTEGYGLSEGVCKRILDSKPRPSCVITGDCGSSDEARIVELKKAGIDVIVTDHHAFPAEGPPPSAYAVVSPVHPDGDYPDPTIAGGYVFWLLMTRVRKALIETGSLPQDAPSLGRLIDFCAVSTVADCVSLASTNNRIIVKNGLRLINQQARPAWKTFTEFVNSQKLLSSDLAFTLGPMINAAGRLSDAFQSVSFLLTTTNAEAQLQLEYLRAQNETRKKIELESTAKAKDIADKKLTDDSYSAVVFLPDGHPGVIGIVASKLKETYGLPSIVLARSDKGENLVTGSARGIDYTRFHCRDALQQVADRHPDLMSAFGGHRAAAGLTIHESGIETFEQAFAEACKLQLDGQELGPTVITDGHIDGYQIDMDLLNELAILQPFGQGFEEPRFEMNGLVLNVRVIGQTRTHLRITFRPDGQSRPIDAVWFNFRDKDDGILPIQPRDYVTCTGSIEANEWQGLFKPQLKIRTCAVSPLQN